MACWINDNGYVLTNVRGRTERAHRVVWEVAYGPIPEGFEIDHINRIRHDNRLENLRLVTLAQNGWNHGTHKHNKLGVKGVRVRTRGKCVDYQCRVTANGIVHRTQKPTLEEAIAWVTETRTRLHGEFANHGDAEVYHRCI